MRTCQTLLLIVPIPGRHRSRRLCSFSMPCLLITGHACLSAMQLRYNARSPPVLPLPVLAPGIDKSRSSLCRCRAHPAAHPVQARLQARAIPPGALQRRRHGLCMRSHHIHPCEPPAMPSLSCLLHPDATLHTSYGPRLCQQGMDNCTAMSCCHDIGCFRAIM